jgi:hypothetical protein
MSKLTPRERARKIGYAFLFGLLVFILYYLLIISTLSIKGVFDIKFLNRNILSALLVYISSVVMKIVFDSLDI